MAVTVPRLFPLVPLISKCWWQCRALVHEEGNVSSLGEPRGFQAPGPEHCVTLRYDAVSLGTLLPTYRRDSPPIFRGLEAR